MELLIKYDYHIVIHGFSGFAMNKNYVGTAFQLSDKMWKVVKGNGIENKGKNVWVYEIGNGVFAGVELLNPDTKNAGLELKEISIKKYAYYKHVGPYQLIKQAGQNMNNELGRMGEKTSMPYIEIYGHWNPDENLQETELIVTLA